MSKSVRGLGRCAAHFPQEQGLLGHQSALISLSHVSLTTGWLFTFARPCSAPRDPEPVTATTAQVWTWHRTAATRNGAALLFLWICGLRCRFQVDWLHGGSVRNSLCWHFNFSCQGCSYCGCLGLRKPNPREPWAIFRGSDTSVLHVHTRNYLTFQSKATTLDIMFKNPRRNSAIIQNPLNEPPTSTFDKHAKRAKLGLDRQEFDWCIINSASWVTKLHSSINYYWNMISSLQLQTKIICLIPELYHSNYDANLL